MTEGEQPSPEQGSGSTPPELGVPEFGAPTDASSGPIPNRPEIVDGNSMPGPHPAPNQPNKRTPVPKWVQLSLLGVSALGLVATFIRHAHASPHDKLVCSATIDVLNDTTASMPTLIHALEFADDKPLIVARGHMHADIAQHSVQGILNDFNSIIARCNQISNDFKHGFTQFCDQNAGLCKHEVHIGPF